MRVILVPLDGAEHDRPALEAARALAARRPGAHIEGLFIRPQPLQDLTVASEGLSPDVVESIARATATAASDRQTRARAAFDAMVAEAGMKLAEYPTGDEAITARWLEASGIHDRVVLEHGRLSDLIVLSGIEDSAAPERSQAFEGALLASARPILAVPPEPPARIGSTVAIAWNGSVEATRALAAALPLLQIADAVHIVTAVTAKTSAEQAQQLAAYLTWHGIASERHVLHPVAEEPGVAILDCARAVGADLLVMGGYGRSRMREMIFGGVTRHVVGALTIPVLLAH